MPILIITIVIYAIYLWLAKCTQTSWILGIIWVAGFCLIRNKYITESMRWSQLCFIFLLIIGLVIIAKVGAPPYKNVPAVDVKNPKKTEVVEIEQGKLTGVYNGEENVEVFAGIPYAKAPVGELRWREPQKPENWEGVLEADHFGPMAMQARSSTIYNSLVDLIIYKKLNIGFSDNYLEPMSEDCLYLNVWKPSGEQNNLPVIVYIHGGSLMTGQSSYWAYNGETYAKNGVVYVTIAYRLNIFGYYANEELIEESDNRTTGNYGLLDQIEALKWVKNNISAFGGNPENITIAGESAGSSSVNAMCVSELTEGLFKRVIAESSGITPIVPYHTFRSMEDALGMGRSILAEYNVTNIEELRKIDAEELIKTKYSNSAMTIDGYAISKQPYLYYENGENHEEALLNGFNAHEADVFNYFVGKITPDNIAQKLEKQFGSYANEAVALYPSSNNREAKESYNQILSAAWFAYSHYDWSRYLVKQGIPVYKYYFYKESKGISNNHSGELVYAYGNLDKNPLAYDKSDENLSEIMVKYWTNFAKTGNPNDEGLPIWLEYSQMEDQVLGLGETVEIQKDPYLEVYKIIDKYQNELR